MNNAKYKKVKEAIQRRKEEKYAEAERKLREKILKELNLPPETVIHISRRGEK